MPTFNEKNQNIDAANISTGNLNVARLPATLPAGSLTGSLPAISGASLTGLSAANLTGSLPAISGASLTGVAKTASGQTFTGGNTFRFDLAGLYHPLTIANQSASTSAEVGFALILADSAGGVSNFGKIKMIKLGTWTPTASTQTGAMVFEIPDGATQRESFRIHNTGALLIGGTAHDGTSKVQVTGAVKATSFIGDGSGLTGVTATSSSGTPEGLTNMGGY